MQKVNVFLEKIKIDVARLNKEFDQEISHTEKKLRSRPLLGFH